MKNFSVLMDLFGSGSPLAWGIWAIVMILGGWLFYWTGTRAAYAKGMIDGISRAEMNMVPIIKLSTLRADAIRDALSMLGTPNHANVQEAMRVLANAAAGGAHKTEDEQNDCAGDDGDCGGRASGCCKDSVVASDGQLDAD